MKQEITAVPEVAFRHAGRGDLGPDAALAQLLGDHEAEFAIGDQDGACEKLGVENPAKPLLERGLGAEEAYDLLGHALARDRPQPRSGGAANDDRHVWSRYER